MEWWQSIVLGLVQGLTEFLPVSSSGHLAIGRWLLGAGVAGEDLVFEVVVHAATVCATIVVFRKEIGRLLAGLFKFRYNAETDYILKICVSMIPVLVVGLFFKDNVEAAFSSLKVVGGALLLTALLLWLSDRRTAGQATSRTSPSTSSTSSPAAPAAPGSPVAISWWQAFVIGLAQACAVIPGLSRSGSTISTGLLCGVKRSDVAQFSFLMVLVPILGEAFLDIVGGDMAASATGLLPLALGFISAFVSGLFACKVMIALVKRASLKWFALYCLLVGTLTLILS